MNDRHISGRNCLGNNAGNRKQRRAREAKSFHGLEYFGDSLSSAAVEKIARQQAGATEVISRDDRNWFATNPSRKMRLRPSHSSEKAINAAHPFAPTSGTNEYTLVLQNRPGARLRIPFKAHAIFRPENYNEQACGQLLEELKGDVPHIKWLVQRWKGV